MSNKLSTPLLLLVIIILGIILFVSSAEAEIVIDPPTNYTNVVDLIYGIATWIRSIGLALAVVVILWAAFMYMTSGGSEEKIAQAKKALLWAVVGIAILIIGTGLIGIIKGILQAK